MSKSLNLVKYQTDESGNIYENGYELVESVFISSDLILEIESNFPLVKMRVLEEEGSDEAYEIECFDEKYSLDIAKKLGELFILVLKNEYETIFGSSDISESKSVGHIKNTNLQTSIDRFRTITNVISIVDLKNEKYENVSSVVLKVG